MALSNCNQCKSRGTVRPHQGVMDTFERYEIGTWQCTKCGVVFERGIGGKFIPTGTDLIILHPNELIELRKQRKGNSR